MASTNTGKTTETKPQTTASTGPKPVAPAPKFAPPTGYNEEKGNSFEISGHWVAESGPCHGKVLGAYDFVKKSDGKLQRVFVIELAEPCTISAKVEGPNGKGVAYENTEASAREIIGVWGAGDLNGKLEGKQGAFVWILRTDEKKKLSGNRAMWIYKVVSKGKGGPLKVRSAKSGDSVADESAPGGQDEELPF